VQGRRIVDQERELGKTRARERLGEIQKRMAAEISQDMFARLERIKTQEIYTSPSTVPQPGRYSDPAVLLVGRVDGDRLVWPWDANPREAGSGRFRDDPEFRRKIQEAERAESNDKERAASLYRSMIETASNAAQRAEARFGLARTLPPAEALRVYRDVLDIPWSVTDQTGLPYAYLAALILMKSTGSSDVLARAKRDLESPNVLQADQVSRLKSVLGELRNSSDAAIRSGAAAALDRLEERVRDLEKVRGLQEARHLQRDFAGLGVTDEDWKPYRGPGGDLWLVGKAPEGIASSPLAFVVDAEAIRKSVEEGRAARSEDTPFSIAVGGDSGQPLGEHLPNLRVTFQSAAEAEVLPESELERSFYGLSLLLVIPLTFLGGYLLWRDTRREIHIAELRSQFVSSVSHELKTPLTSIRMFAEALQMGLAEPQIHSEYLETIVNESERLTRLLNNVLDFSRIERGQKTYRMEPTSLGEVVQSAVRTMRYPLEEQGFVLDLDIPEEMPQIAVDRDAIHQAILNLLTNAMKYSGQRRDIALRLSSKNGSAMIEVSDHGIGIPAKDQPHIFEKFYRAQVPENRAVSGTGLGLALVAHIAEAHGGSVHVASTPGEGSTFTIHLPLEGKRAA
jgi:signal transduction histidine kinase